MTLLEKTFNILKQDDIELEHRFVKPSRPEDGHPFKFNPFNIPNVRSVKCTKERLSKVLAFIDMKKQVRFADGFTVMNIATVNKRLLSMCGTQPSVSNLISYMITIGLLAEYDEEYQFNGYYSHNNKCKKYVYSYDTEVLIKQYCIDNNINKYQIKNNNIYTIVKKFGNTEVKSFEKSEVRFSSKLQLLKPDNWSTTEFEEYLTMCLYENYPHLQHYQELADYINETYYADDMDRQIQFKPNFTWKKGNQVVRKIGIRATNSLVSCKKEVEEGDEDNILYRQEVLNKYGLSYEFDVKSSVPRVTFLLNKGIWLDNNIDLYECMFDHFIGKCPSEKLEWNKETREVFKNFHMRGYFDTYSQMATHIKLAISKKAEYRKSDWNGLDYVMKSYKESIEETVGTLKYDSEVFFHESCIYLDVLFTLLKRGLNVLQIYDGFYINEECKEIEEIVKQMSERYYYEENIVKKNENVNIHTIVKKFGITDETTINDIAYTTEEVVEFAEKVFRIHGKEIGLEENNEIIPYEKQDILDFNEWVEYVKWGS